MSQASGVRSALPPVSVVTSAGGGGKLWKRWQITYVVGRAVFLIGFFLLMEYHHGRDPSLFLGTLFGSTLPLQATTLLAVGTLLELVLFAVLNRWRDRRPQSGVALRSLTGLAGETVLWVVCFAPAFYIMFVGPAIVEIVNTLSRGQP
jgi:hypothetical protein